MRIVSLLPAATEIAAALGLMDEVVAVSHECDYPAEASQRPRITRCPLLRNDLSSAAIHNWVGAQVGANAPIYTIDEPLLRQLEPDLILTQKLCDVCAIDHGTVARLASTLSRPPKLVNLEPSSLADIFQNIREVASNCGVRQRADDLVAGLSARVERVRRQPVNHRPTCFLLEWADPPFCSGHWNPELVEIAGGYDPLGRKHAPSVRIQWEQVLEARPEIMVLALCGYDLARAGKDLQLLRSLPRFDSLPAVGKNAVYIVDGNAFFSRPGPRVVDGLELLAGILHPEAFPEFTPSALGEKRVVRADITIRR